CFNCRPRPVSALVPYTTLFRSIRLGDLLQKFVARANQTVLDLVDAARVSARPKAATEYGLRKLDVIFRAAKLPPKFLEVLRERTLNGLGRTHGSPDHMDENCL